MKDSSQLGYLWSRNRGDWPNCTRENGWIKHPITKITAQRVVIAKEPLKRDRRYQWKKDFRRQRWFDWKDLERRGYVSASNYEECFYTDASRARFEAERPNWLAEELARNAERAKWAARFDSVCFTARTFPLLQLTTPFSREDVTKRFRQRALELDPDHGGNAAQFQQLVMERDQALNLWMA
jgi:hypothetical protein